MIVHGIPDVSVSRLLGFNINVNAEWIKIGILGMLLSISASCLSIIAVEMLGPWGTMYDLLKSTDIVLFILAFVILIAGFVMAFVDRKTD